LHSSSSPPPSPSSPPPTPPLPFSLFYLLPLCVPLLSPSPLSCFLETGSFYVSQGDLKLMILLSQPP
jgi:hypothetical protein